MLDWYFACDDTYLSNLEVLDKEMGKVSTFKQELLSLDIMIGSDLLYFDESIAPLFKMISKFFEINASLHFYMCMMRRDQNTHNELLRCIDLHSTEMKIERIDEEYITAQATEMKASCAYLYHFCSL